MGLWAVGRMDLGLTETEVWRSTPRLIFLLLKRKKEIDEGERLWAELRIGRLCALVANVGYKRDKGQRAYEARDFFSGLPKEVPREQSTEEQIAAFRGLTE